MSVQETYSITVDSPEHGLVVGSRLASGDRASLRWVSLWTTRALAPEFRARFGERLASPEAGVLILPSPTLDGARFFLERAGDDPVCAHWSPPLYVSDEGPEPPWLSFVDAFGRRREDARLYAIELAGNAVPLTTLGDRPSDTDFVLGPTPASGWRLHLRVIRDHLPREELLAWIADAAGVPRARCDQVSFGG